jgi:hypothetical protein
MSVVDRVLEALNTKDVDAFVACYADDATIEDGDDRVLVRGHAQLRERYGPMFERYPQLRVEGGRRIEAGAFVVQDETVTGRGDPEHHVAVYKLANDLIVRERLLA